MGLLGAAVLAARCGGGSPTAPSQATPGGTPLARRLGIDRILAFGDSITMGEDGRPETFGLFVVDPASSYPSVLQSLIQQEYPGEPVTVINDGKSGEPIACTGGGTSCGLARLPGDLAQHQPDAVLLLEGYNDLAGGLVAVGRTVAAVREAVRAAKQTGVRFVFVGTLTPGRKATGLKDRQLDPEAILRTNAGIADVAAAESAFLVDMHAAFVGREQELVHDDGLHPTAAGSQVLAETAFRAILSAVR